MLILLNIIFQILLLGINSEDPKIIDASYDFTGGTMLMTIGVGSLSTIRGVRIDIQRNFTYLYLYPTDEKSTIKRNGRGKITIQNRISYASIVEDFIFLTDEKFSNVRTSFYLYSLKDINVAETVGLGYNYANKSFSLIHNLYEKGAIGKLKFAFGDKGKLFLGGIPTKLRDDLFRYGECNVNKHYTEWNCRLYSTMILNNNGKSIFEGVINENIIFSSLNKLFFVPEQVYHTIKLKVFSPYLGNKTCSETATTESEGYFLLTCISKEIQCSPKISFILGNNKFELTKKELFDCDQMGKFIFLIRKSPFKENQWVFGTNFYKKFTTEFDFEKEKIYFYSKEQNWIGLTKPRIILILVFFVIMFILLVNIGIFWSVSNKRQIMFSM